MSALESEDQLAFAGVIDDGEAMDQAQCRRLFDLPAEAGAPRRVPGAVAAELDRTVSAFRAAGGSLNAIDVTQHLHIEFERVMRRMCGEEDGTVDALFRFSRPVTGGYYWCPAVADGKLDLRPMLPTGVDGLPDVEVPAS